MRIIPVVIEKYPAISLEGFINFFELLFQIVSVSSLIPFIVRNPKAMRNKSIITKRRNISFVKKRKRNSKTISGK